MMNITTRSKLANNSIVLTPELREYLGKVTITAQASYDRWPEANGMRRNLWELANEAGVSSEQVSYDLDHAPISCDGGRW